MGGERTDRNDATMGDELDRLLAALPRERARRGFTDGVLSRIDGGPVRRRRWLLLAATGAAAALLVAVAALHLERERSGRDELALRIAELRRDHARLSEELRQLRTRLRREQPVLYLGGDDRVDYVLDLRRLVGDGEGVKKRDVSRGESL